MNIELSPESEQRVVAMIQSGRFADAAAVVDTAVGMLADEDPLGQYAPGELDALLDEAIADVDAGRTYSMDEVKSQLAKVLAEVR